MAATQGAIPYIMAIAMMYASPIAIVALTEGKYKKKRTVRRVSTVRTIQPLLCSVVIRSHAAHRVIGAAQHISNMIYALSLAGRSAHVINYSRINCSLYRQLLIMTLALPIFTSCYEDSSNYVQMILQPGFSRDSRISISVCI